MKKLLLCFIVITIFCYGNNNYNEMYFDVGWGLNAGDVAAGSSYDLGFNFNIAENNYFGLGYSQKIANNTIHDSGYNLTNQVTYRSGDLFYLLKYKGMNIFTNNESNDFFKIGARFISFGTKLIDDNNLYRDLELLGVNDPEYSTSIKSCVAPFVSLGSEVELSNDLIFNAEIKYTRISTEQENKLSAAGINSVTEKIPYQGGFLDFMFCFKKVFITDMNNDDITAEDVFGEQVSSGNSTEY